MSAPYRAAILRVGLDLMTATPAPHNQPHVSRSAKRNRPAAIGLHLASSCFAVKAPCSATASTLVVLAPA